MHIEVREIRTRGDVCCDASGTSRKLGRTLVVVPRSDVAASIGRDRTKIQFKIRHAADVRELTRDRQALFVEGLGRRKLTRSVMIDREVGEAVALVALRTGQSRDRKGLLVVLPRALVLALVRVHHARRREKFHV